ncbi:MAG: response regulator [Ktedonobacteraceae bacterium]
MPRGRKDCKPAQGRKQERVGKQTRRAANSDGEAGCCRRHAWLAALSDSTKLRPYDLALVDLGLPRRITGREVIAWLRRQQPARAVIALSANARALTEVHEWFGVSVLLKPSLLARLARVIAQALHCV